MERLYKKQILIEKHKSKNEYVDFNSPEGRKTWCIECKHMKQSSSCCVCGNIKQTNNALKSYVYYCFTCDLFENSEFNSMSHQERIQCGYKSETHINGTIVYSRIPI